MAQQKTKRFWILIALAIVSLFLIFKFLSGSSNSVVVSAIEVKEATIEAYIDEHARTSLPHIYHITMPMQGRILPLQVNEGDEVTKGQFIAKMEDTEWQEAKLEVEAIITTFESWLESSEAQLKASQVRLEYDKWNWERHEKLAKTDAVSEREMRNTKRNYLDSSEQVESSQAMHYATKALQSIVDLLPGYVNRNYNRTTITSPVAGTILKRHVWNEKMVTAGAPLLEVGDLQELEVTADILTEEAVYVHPGDRVVIYGSSLGDKTLPGVIRLVEPQAFTKISSLGVEEQRVAVKVSFTKEAKKQIEKAKFNLGLQYRVRVKIITKEKPSVLTVPRTALFIGKSNEWQLYRIKDGKARLTQVTIGLINDDEAEVSSGLSKGDSVISMIQSNLDDGVKVKSRLQ